MLPVLSQALVRSALLAAFALTSCKLHGPRSTPENPILHPRQRPPSVAVDEGNPLTESLNLDFGELILEVNATPRTSSADDAYGFGIYAYPEAGWGAGLQVQGTLTSTNPEVEVVLAPPAAELAGRDTEITVDFVATYRVSSDLGLFAGVGLASIEEFRRFEDAIGNDFFVSQDEDLRGNLTAGGHLWLTDWLVVSAQWDSIFEAATFGVGLNL